MNLADKRELLEQKKLKIEVREMELEKLIDKTKNFQGTEKEMKSIEMESQEIEKTINELKTEVSKLEQELKTEEKTLKEISDETKKQKCIKGVTKMDYLQTKEALNDFAEILKETGGRDKFKKAWEAHLKTKSISDGDNVLLPGAVVQAITDGLGKSGDIFKTFHYTGLDVFKMAMDTNSSRNRYGLGHEKGNSKLEREITLDAKELRPQYIYQYIEIDKEMIRENRNTGVLLRYVLSEMPKRIVAAIETVAMIGEHQSNTWSASIRSYEAISRTTADDYVSVQTATDNFVEDLVKMDATITAPGDRYLVISRQTLAELKLASNGNAMMFPFGSDIASALGYKAIFTPDFMSDGDLAWSSNTPKAIEYVGQSYYVVGDNTMDSYSDFELEFNKNRFLMEIYSGGGLVIPKSAAVLKKATGD